MEAGIPASLGSFFLRSSSMKAESRSPRVLVVEDDAEVRALVAEALGRAGYAVAEVADGTAAIERIEVTEFLVVVLDLILPGLSGLDVLRRIQTLPAARRPHVVIVSGGNAEIPGAYAISRARMHNPDAVLYKPFTPQELVATIRRLTARHGRYVSDKCQQTRDG